MDRAGVQAWVELYERAWRTPGTELLAELFAPEATLWVPESRSWVLSCESVGDHRATMIAA